MKCTVVVNIRSVCSNSLERPFIDNPLVGPWVQRQIELSVEEVVSLESDVPLLS